MIKGRSWAQTWLPFHDRPASRSDATGITLMREKQGMVGDRSACLHRVTGAVGAGRRGSLAPIPVVTDLVARQLPDGRIDGYDLVTEPGGADEHNC